MICPPRLLHFPSKPPRRKLPLRLICVSLLNIRVLPPRICRPHACAIPLPPTTNLSPFNATSAPSISICSSISLRMISKPHDKPHPPNNPPNFPVPPPPKNRSFPSPPTISNLPPSRSHQAAQATVSPSSKGWPLRSPKNRPRWSLNSAPSIWS